MNRIPPLKDSWIILNWFANWVDKVHSILFPPQKVQTQDMHKVNLLWKRKRELIKNNSISHLFNFYYVWGTCVYFSRKPYKMGHSYAKLGRPGLFAQASSTVLLAAFL